MVVKEKSVWLPLLRSSTGFATKKCVREKPRTRRSQEQIVETKSIVQEHREHCQQVTRTMKEGSGEEMDLHIQKMREDAEQESQERRLASHTTFVEQIIKARKEELKMLHQVTGPTPWRGGATLFRTPEEDAAEGARIGTKFQEWYCIGKLVKSFWIQIKPSDDQELRSNKEALPPLKVRALRRAAAECEVRTVLGMDSFHPWVPLDLTDDCCERIFTMLHKVEMAGKWPH